MTIKAKITPRDKIHVTKVTEIQGLTGFTGSAGSSGSPGFTGSEGGLGYTGSKGAGFTGSKGDSGLTGSFGFVGSRGLSGFVGSRGSIGFSGSKGDSGLTGSIGPRGISGFVGSRGFTGQPGVDGSRGYTGSIGVGFAGSKGAVGFTGSSGVGIGIVWQYTTTSVNAVSGDFLLVNADIEPVTIVLPASPSIGDFITISNVSTTTDFDLIVARNGQTIEDLAENLQIDLLDSKIELIFNGTTWELISNTASFGYLGSNVSSGGGAGSPIWIKTSTTYSTNPFDNVMVDVTNNPVSIHLPFMPVLGTSISIADVSDVTTYQITINRNGQTIEKQSDNLVIDISASKLDFVFDGNTWRIFMNSGIIRT